MLSNTSKLGCKSWSLQAIETCPGSVGANGQLVEVCQGCYATTGNYRFSNVKRVRSVNKEEWKLTSWTHTMIDLLKHESHFRWFDSGDLYSLELAEKVYDVCKATPWCKHWIPTRMHKFVKFQEVLERLNALDNVVVRYSGDNIDEAPKGKWVSLVIKPHTKPDMAYVCPAYQQEGKCNGCRECWSKQAKSIAYPAHGRKMSRVISLQLFKEQT